MQKSWMRGEEGSGNVKVFENDYPFVEDFTKGSHEHWVYTDGHEDFVKAALKFEPGRIDVAALAVRDRSQLTGALGGLEALARAHTLPTVVIQYAPHHDAEVQANGYHPMQVKRWMRLDLSPAQAPTMDTEPVLPLKSVSPSDLAALYTAAYQVRFPKLVMTEDNLRAFFLEDEDEPLVTEASGLIVRQERPVGAVIVQQRSMADLHARYGKTPVLQTDPEFWVSELFVHPDFCGRGFGRLLLDHAASHVAARGADALNLNVDLDNAGAERLYRRRGFVTAGEPARRARKTLDPA